MKISDSFEKKINKSVVRIIADSISINWSIPYQIEKSYKGQGTGFFINKKGYILTCAHVVDSANNIYIEIPYLNSNKYKCEIVSICPQFDIALIKCNEYKNDEYLELGNSDKLEIRSEVIVIGYPVSLHTSSNNVNNLKYTIGIVNGQQSSFIQTDSAINPGNSGGPLIFNNKVIGINSQKLIGYHIDNVGFAVPINYYKIIKDDFDKKIIYRPKLLFEFDNSDKNIIKIITNNKIDKGIIISKIYDTSPLKKTNIKEGSIITHINNYQLDSNGYTLKYKWLGTNINLSVLLNKFKNNEVIKITYYDKNNNKINYENVKLEPFIPSIREIYPSLETIDYFILGGMIFVNFSENYLKMVYKNDIIPLKYLYLKKDELINKKIIVSFIVPNSKVNLLNNIKTFDIISKVNDININSLDNLRKALNKPIIINKEKYIKISNENNKSIIISIKDIIKEDKAYSKIYKYSLNSFHENYM